MDGAIVQVAPDGTVIYRASSLAGCSKALVASRLGYEPAPPPKQMQKVFDAGHVSENVVVEKLKNDGWHVFDREMAVDLPITGKVKVRGHIDGKVIPEMAHRNIGSAPAVSYLPSVAPSPFLLEIKSQNATEYNSFAADWSVGLWPKYQWQVSVYMHVTRLPLMLVRYCRDDGRIDVRYYDDPFIDLASIRTRVLLAESVALQGALPERCDVAQYPCPYYRLHEDADVAELVDDESLEVAAREYETARVDVKVAEGRLSSARKVLELAVRERGPRLRTVGGVKVTSWTQKNPPRLNAKLLERWLKYIGRGEYVGRLWAQTESGRLKVTLPKDENAEVKDE